MNKPIVGGLHVFAKFSSQQLTWLHLIGEKFREIAKDLWGIFVPWWVLLQKSELYNFFLHMYLQGKKFIIFLIID